MKAPLRGHCLPVCWEGWSAVRSADMAAVDSCDCGSPMTGEPPVPLCYGSKFLQAVRRHACCRSLKATWRQTCRSTSPPTSSATWSSNTTKAHSVKVGNAAAGPDHSLMAIAPAYVFWYSRASVERSPSSIGSSATEAAQQRAANNPAYGELGGCRVRRQEFSTTEGGWAPTRAAAAIQTPRPAAAHPDVQRATHCGLN